MYLLSRQEYRCGHLRCWKKNEAVERKGVPHGHEHGDAGDLDMGKDQVLCDSERKGREFLKRGFEDGSAFKAEQNKGIKGCTSLLKGGESGFVLNGWISSVDQRLCSERVLLVMKSSCNMKSSLRSVKMATVNRLK